MLKMGFLFSILFFFLNLTIDAQVYLVRYQSLTSGSLFHVETREGEKIGRIIRERDGGSVHYSFFSFDERLIATGQTERHFSDTIVHIKDPIGIELGWFAAEIHSVYPNEYKVFNAENRLVSKGYMNWIGSAFFLADPENSKKHLVTYFRPMFKLFNDYWHFDVHVEGVMDFRLLSIIGVFQTACDLNFEMLDIETLYY